MSVDPRKHIEHFRKFDFHPENVFSNYFSELSAQKVETQKKPRNQKVNPGDKSRHLA
jgi:hypothetical protein